MNKLFSIDQFSELMYKFAQQTSLTLMAVCIAAIISIPAGILIAKKKSWRTALLGFSNVLQTLPTLAVLGFLIPFFGIGMKTALITIILYAIMPILRNTMIGLLGISEDYIEAADGLGLTSFQKLKLIEIPLAMPVIIGGIRTATVIAVSIATLAAFVGAGGLGDYIYEGLSLNNSRLILLGAIPAAILALSLDYLISRLEKLFTPLHHTVNSRWKKWVPITLLFTFAFYFTFVTIKPYQDKAIRIGSKNFSEQLILSELLAQLLENDTSLKIIKVFNIGSTLTVHKALVYGDIDIYPEYTGTGYTVILHQTQEASADKIYNFVKENYQKTYNITWLKAFGFNNSNALAVRREIANRYHLHNISDLKNISTRLSLGAPTDFKNRLDGMQGLDKKYHLKFGQVRLMDMGLLYEAAHEKQLDVIMTYSTDGRISENNLVILKDDKALFPSYFAAPLIRTAALKRHPEIEQVLNLLHNKINNKIMLDLNYQVDVLKRSPEVVASDFIKSHLTQKSGNQSSRL